MLLTAPHPARAQDRAGQASQGVQSFQRIADLNIDELKRLIQTAREAGFTDAQIQDITVEDPDGHVVKAWAYIQEYERRKKEEEARKEAERKKVYLTPQDITAELDKKQTQEIEQLRDKLLLVP